MGCHFDKGERGLGQSVLSSWGNYCLYICVQFELEGFPSADDRSLDWQGLGLDPEGAEVEPVAWQAVYCEGHCLSWQRGSRRSLLPGEKLCQSSSHRESSTSPRSAPQEKKKRGVSHERGSGRDPWYHMGQDKVWSFRHWVAIPPSSGERDPQDLQGQDSVLLSGFCHPEQNLEVWLPTSSSPVQQTTALQTPSCFHFSVPFSPFKSP